MVVNKNIKEKLKNKRERVRVLFLILLQNYFKIL